MDLAKVDIDSVKPAKYNPRKDLTEGMEEFEKIKASIQKFGYVDPIVVNKKTGNIVGGHQRWKVLKHLGYTEIDVIFISVDVNTEKALNIALNKISGEWDLVKLKDLFLEFDKKDIFYTGFSTPEIDTILGNFDMPEIEKEPPEKIVRQRKILCPHCGEQFEL